MQRLEHIERDMPKPRLLSDYNSEAGSPFTKRVRDLSMARSFKLPQPLETYNGNRDLDSFIQMYKWAMELKQVNEVALFNCFKVALAGSTSFWYNSLPSDSINSFGELGSKFSTHFIGSRKSSERAIQMFDVIKKLNETIQEFVERFNQEAVHALDLSNDVRIMAFVKALLPTLAAGLRAFLKEPIKHKRDAGVSTPIAKEAKLNPSFRTSSRHKER